MEDETIELQQIQRDLLLEQQKAAEKKLTMQAEQTKLQWENRERIKAKAAAKEQAIAEDKMIMENTLKNLEAKEQRRLAELQAFHV